MGAFADVVAGVALLEHLLAGFRIAFRARCGAAGDKSGRKEGHRCDVSHPVSSLIASARCPREDGFDIMGRAERIGTRR
jgi:hypothetical protein